MSAAATMPGVSAIIIFTLAFAVMVLAIAVVAARELLRNVRKLNEQVRATTERLAPLTQELQSELAVTSVEVDELTRSVERVQKDHAARSRRSRSRRKR